MNIEKMIENAWDLHVHTDPDVIKRKLTDLEMAKRFSEKKMKGFAIKSHVSMTTGRARLINELFLMVTAIGTVTLNNSVGGINPYAVELAIRDGAKLVWLPTIDSLNETRHIEHTAATHPEKLPFFAKFRMELAEKGKLQKPLIIAENGNLTEQMLDVLDIICEHNIALATGHISPEESIVLAKHCNKIKYGKLIITHPNFPSTTFTKEQQRELAELGCFLEHCVTTPLTNKITWEQVYQEIKYVGCKNCIISTDLGQPAYVFPDEGIQIFAENLLENGFKQEDINRMICLNPETLIS